MRLDSSTIIIKRLIYNIENLLAFFILLLLALLPTLEIILRTFFKTGFHSASEYIQHLVLWLTFIGSMITSREKKHLRLTVGVDFLNKNTKEWVRTITALIAVVINSILAWYAWLFVKEGFDPHTKIGIFPIKLIISIMPIGFIFLAYRSIFHAGGKRIQKIIASSGIIIALLVGFSLNTSYLHFLIWPFTLLLLISGLFGTPIFIVLGGLSIILFFHSGGSLAIIHNEAYTMLTSPIIPTIPLFTLAGFILSESRAGERLIHLFQACFGWLPGGLAIMAILISAFFTTFTGASGVTILALGGLLSFVLIKSNYYKNFS